MFFQWCKIFNDDVFSLECDRMTLVSPGGERPLYLLFSNDEIPVARGVHHGEIQDDFEDVRSREGGFGKTNA